MDVKSTGPAAIQVVSSGILVDYRDSIVRPMQLFRFPINSAVSKIGLSRYAQRLLKTRYPPNLSDIFPSVGFEVGLWNSGGGINSNELQESLMDLDEGSTNHYWYLAGLEHVLISPVAEIVRGRDRVLAPGSSFFDRGTEYFSCPALLERDGRPGLGRELYEPDDKNLSCHPILVVRPLDLDFRVDLPKE